MTHTSKEQETGFPSEKTTQSNPHTTPGTRKQHKRLLLMVLMAVTGSIVLQSVTIPEKWNYNLLDNHSFSISGTSNVRDWSENVETVSGNAMVTINKDKSFNLDAVNIKMDVYSIKSTNGSIMNNSTYKALKADRNPNIIYTLKQAIRAIKPGAEKKVFLAKGQLTIAGVTRDANMMMTLLIQESGKFILEGSQELQMTDYGIVPPTALLGTLKTGNTIIIKFRSEFKDVLK